MFTCINANQYTCMCTEPGGQTVACLRLIMDEPSVQDYCFSRGWLVYDSYEVPHVYRARWRDACLPAAHLRRAICPRPLLGRRCIDIGLYGAIDVYRAR
jgi:hypothetical protein